MTTPLSVETIKRAPKALLHDHLDGGLRPATVIDIAGQTGYDGLPATDADALAQAVTRLATDPMLRQRLGAAGREAAVARFDRSRLAEEWGRVYASETGKVPLAR